MGKGANCIISMLHHFLEKYSFGETHLHLHADNCSGQNKNRYENGCMLKCIDIIKYNTRYMMAYLMWRVMTGLSKEVTISFLLVGHTKFAPDWGFGLFKRLFKKSNVATIQDIAEVVQKSAVVNHPQLIGDYDGSTYVKFYNWSNIFDDYTIAIKGITKFHHFRMSSCTPGYVFVREGIEDPEKKINIIKNNTWMPSQDTMPPLIDPPGLPLERQWYLYNKIREFCPDEAKDLVCPKPSHTL